MTSRLTPGTQVLGFTVHSVNALDEYRATGIHLVHDKSGCEVYHVHSDDPENLFAFAFPTLPDDSSGVAHILEHTVLCGSERFPVKDPFLLMLKGSMNTFLNAFTFPDKTVYPASSTVEKDYFNLMEVYGDAVFFPQLKKEMFRQEGHRLEFDDEGILRRTGIVLNEMKGAYSTHESVASDWSYRSLFEDHPYAFDSGGDPAHIPDLGYDQFKAFHAKHYHPSNTLIFLYGNIPTEKNLAFLEEKFLSRFGKLDAKVRVPAAKPWKEPKRFLDYYPASAEDEEGGKASITLNWLLKPVDDALETLAFELLAEILIGSAASPLQRALVDSGLGEDLSAPSGLETELINVIFSVGLRGTEKGREDQLEKLVTETLETLVRDGLDADLVEGTLRRFEFRSREIKGGGPFGLRLMRRSLRGWLHGSDPARTMTFAPLMTELRGILRQNPRYFEDLIRDRILSNPQRSTVTVVPDPEMNEREEAKEREELDGLAASMGPGERERLKEEQEALAAYQSQPDSPEAIATIPFLGESDIPRTVTEIPSESLSIHAGGDVIPVLAHEIYTNGVSYIDLCFDLEALSEDDLRYLTLFSSLVPGLGVPGLGYEETATRLNLLTGGFSAYTEAGLRVRSSFDQVEELSIKLFFRLRALDSGVKEALEFAGKLVTDADFSDHKRVYDLFVELKNDFQSSLVQSGSSFASLRAERYFSVCDAIEEEWRGINQYLFLLDLHALGADALGAKLEEKLVEIRRKIVRRGGLNVNLTGSSEAIQANLHLIADWVSAIPSRAMPKRVQHTDFLLDARRKEYSRMEALLLPSKVAYCAAVVPGALYGGKGASHETLLSHLMRTGILWEKIRMQGGAYGASAINDSISGLFSFSSYRDPRIGETYDAFKEALELFASDALSDQELLLARIACVAKDLRPLAPSEAGLVAFRRKMYGIETGIRQARRDDILSAKKSDIANAAARLLASWENRTQALIAGQEMVDKEEKQRKGFRPLRTRIPL